MILRSHSQDSNYADDPIHAGEKSSFYRYGELIIACPAKEALLLDLHEDEVDSHEP